MFDPTRSNQILHSIINLYTILPSVNQDGSPQSSPSRTVCVRVSVVFPLRAPSPCGAILIFHSTQSLVKLGQTLLSKGPHKTESTPKRVRVRFNNVFVVDTIEATYVWEHPYYPQYAYILALTPSAILTENPKILLQTLIHQKRHA